MAEIRFSGMVGVCMTSLPCSLLVASVSLPLATLLAFVIYQLYFHPLAKYPGPLLGRITRLYDLYHAYIGDKHVLIYRLHQRYGTVVRFTPNTLSIDHPDALKAIYAHGANVQKSEFYKCFRAAPNAISTLLATEKPHHARKRRVAGQAFSDQAIRGLEQYVLGHVQDLIGRIGREVKQTRNEKTQWSRPMDMQKWCNWLVFDIMGDLVFGKPFGTLGDHPENRKGIWLLGRAARRNYTIATFPTLMYTGLEKWIPPFRGLYRDKTAYLAFGKKQVLARTQAQQASGDGGTGRRDIFSFLLHAKDPETGEGFPMPELWMEGNTLIVAGSDTTSTTLAACLHHLLTNPPTLLLLEREVRSTFLRAEDIRMGLHLSACTWLRACIDETLRISPAVPGLLPREVQQTGLSIPSLGLHLPAGVNVGTGIYSIHHNAAYVSNPFTFDPSRWLDDSTSQDKAALQSIFTPFSLGNRACLGKPLVYMELGIALARLVWEFDMRLTGELRGPAFAEREGRRPGEYHVQDWFMSNNFGPWVEFRLRRERDEEGRADSAFGDGEGEVNLT